MMSEIKKLLLAAAEKSYKDFSCKLMPDFPSELVLGVRMPQLRRITTQIYNDGAGETFLEKLPHEYHEENILHALLIGKEKNTERCIAKLNAFLPYVDNWAVCDSIPMGALKQDLPQAEEQMKIWLADQHEYTIRFALRVLMCLFLEDHFRPEFLELAAVKSEAYYVRMMSAWYFATALAKQRDAALDFLRQGRLEPWVHNKTIQKAIESFRISPEDKALLRKMKIK